MDWIDPRFADEIRAADGDDASAGATGKSGKPRRKSLANRMRAALAQPIEVWSAAYDHALGRLSWPKRVTSDSSFLWSCVLLEQAEILVRAGMSAKLISGLAQPTAERMRVEATDLPADELPALDSVGQSELQRETVSGLMSWPIETMAAKWLGECDREADAALGLAAFLWQLPDHARRSGNTWLGPWLQDAVSRAASSKCDSEDSVLCELVLKVELPLLLGTVTGAGKRTHFPEAFEAMDRLALLLEQAEDQPGRWLAYGASYLRAALGSVLRARVLADALGLRKFYAPQRLALAGLLEHAARWTRKGGTSLLGVTGRIPDSDAHWNALLKIAKRSKSLANLLALVDLTARGTDRRLAKSANAASGFPADTHYCHAARTVCMQTDWRKRGGRLAIDFSDSPMAIEVIGPKGVTLLGGRWPLQVELDGQAQMQLDDWEEVCWYSDDEVDYLEIEARFGDSCCVQRQAMLFREDGLVLLADAMIGDREGKWTMQSSLPLGPGIQHETTAATRESWLVSPQQQRALVLPLGLPEWKRSLAPGKLSLEDAAISMRTTTQSLRMYAPLLISIKPSHATKPLTWRQLTVAEDLVNVPPSVAAAFRVQVGREQWLIYRTLAEPTRRTTLGLHTIYDFFVGRFDGHTGDLDTLVEVETT